MTERVPPNYRVHKGDSEQPHAAFGALRRRWSPVVVRPVLAGPCDGEGRSPCVGIVPDPRVARTACRGR